MEISVAGTIRSKWGEGPVWWQGCLYYVDIEGHQVVKFDPDSGEEQVFPVGERVGTIVPREQGGFVIAGDSGFHFLNDENGELTPISDPETKLSDNRFNDGKCSPDGRFFAGTISTTKKTGSAALYVLEKDKSVRKIFGDVTNSNGLAWNGEGTKVYYIDTPSKTVCAFDYNSESGDWANGEAVVDTSEIEHSPDGMTIDEDGHLWVAFCHGGMVVRYDVSTGKEIQRVNFPCVETTSCTWGGEKLDELYVTTGIHKTLEEELAGRLFVVKGLGIRGYPATAYQG